VNIPLVVESQVWHRVFQFQGEVNTGSAFVIELQDGSYLITANHLTNGDSEELIKLRGINNLDEPHEMLLTRIGDPDLAADVAIFKLEESIVPQNFPVDISAQIVISQEIMVLGYPSSIELQPGTVPITFPMVKRGILGGIKRVDEAALLFLDIIANPGMSGGPVIHRDIRTGIIGFSGVIKGTMTQRANLSEDWPTDLPAGISVATSIEEVQKIVAATTR
jgi:hypothetical protein